MRAEDNAMITEAAKDLISVINKLDFEKINLEIDDIVATLANSFSNGNKLYQKETYVNLNNLQDTPDLSMIYHVSGSDNLKIRFTHSYGRVMNKEYDYDLKVGDLVMFSSNINHIIFNSREENTLLLVHYQHQNP